MPHKDSKKDLKSVSQKSSMSEYLFGEEIITPRSISLSLILQEEIPASNEWIFVTVFNGHILIETKWHGNQCIQYEALSIDMNQPFYQSMVATYPLFFLLRIAGGKGSKDQDPLLSPDNRAGATVDLFPFVLNEEEIHINVPFIDINSGHKIHYSIDMTAKCPKKSGPNKIPLTLTMLSAHCLPCPREGTVFMSSIALNNIHEPQAVNFGMSLSSASATNLVWASGSNAGFAANTAYAIPNEDSYIPEELVQSVTNECTSFYWNSVTRVLVNADSLRERLTAPFLVEVAGVPRFGKIEVRGRYMAFVDGGVLLESGQYGVTICAKLSHYNEANLPEGVEALLDLPPTSAKTSVRETDLLTDEYGHSAYIVLRFDLYEPLISKSKIATLFEELGFHIPPGHIAPMDELRADQPPEDPAIDVRRIRTEGGALSVHKELSGLACRGTVQMNQSIKRTAANKLLLRTRSLLKQFPPYNCSYLEWQDTVTAQHAACRRAVTASFAPQPPPPRTTSRIAAARSRLTGNMKISNEHIQNNLIAAPHHPRVLLSMALRCLEQGKDSEAHHYILKGLSAQARNRYLLWIFGGMEYNKPDSYEKVNAAFRIAVKGDSSDGITGVVGWAALHAFYHHNQNYYSAFVSARKMRKSFELTSDWKKWLQRWIDTSGEEEIFWIPSSVDTKNPFVIAAAFLLCLRCYSFGGRLLKCAEDGCATRGSRFGSKTVPSVDIFYLRSASCLLQRQLDEALDLTNQGIKRFGPSAMISQMRAICLTCLNGWDGECESALVEADNQGATPCPLLLLQAALGGMKNDPTTALQRAARAHKTAPSAQSALVIARIYMKMSEDSLAERWAAAAVKVEPLLADGWAVLALLAMHSQDIDKARAMMRTVKQTGPISSDINDKLIKMMKILNIETLPDALVKNICFCNYY
ncbi:hypothetical protein KGM_200148 [Danaus plexippus plexippus]|uniref:Uncharacterized protein n=1 Tax=Danaus plexippus plexippus TaxID=278856 RepID=A0A212EX02_DANPL|nr:hypothetical protein KGM_200148 [Danaus plexippus plexippus]